VLEKAFDDLLQEKYSAGMRLAVEAIEEYLDQTDTVEEALGPWHERYRLGKVLGSRNERAQQCL
jgi:hypothetical protein